jgi:hypothetical protein
MLRYGYLGVGLGGVGWGNDVHVNLHTQKNTNLCQKRSSFGDFQNPIFHVNMKKNDVSL